MSGEAWVAGAVAALRGDPGGVLRRRVLEMIKARYGAVQAILTDSGTSALRLAIEGAARGTERPVALPGYGCYDLATAAEGAGAKVVLYDLDPATLGPDPDSLREQRGLVPSVVVVAHLFGHLVDVTAVGDVVDDAFVIEDAAQGVGGTLHGRRLGSFGSLSVLSFGRGKGMTGGGGGALLAHDERGLAALQWVLDNQRPEAKGRGGARVLALGAQMLLGRPALYALPAGLPFLHLGETRYHPPEPPADLPPASLAVVDRVMRAIDTEAGVWRVNALRLRQAMSRSQGLRGPADVAGGDPGCLRLPAIMVGGRRGTAVDRTATCLGIARGYPKTLDSLPSLASRLVAPPRPLRGSAELAASLVTLPTHGLLTERDLLRLEDWIGREG